MDHWCLLRKEGRASPEDTGPEKGKSLSVLLSELQDTPSGYPLDRGSLAEGSLL